MAERGFRGEVNLGHGFVEFGQIEEGIIAEASTALGPVSDDSFDYAFGSEQAFAIACIGQHAAVACAAFGFGDGLQLAEKKAVVGFVVAFPGKSIVGGVAGGANSRVAVECVDFETRVVGNDVVARG